MAAGPTLSANLATIIPKIYEVARQTQIEEPKFRSLSTGLNIASKAGNTVDYPKWNNFAAITLDETTDLTPLDLTTSNVTLTVAERGSMTVISDQAVEDANEDVIKRHGVIMGEALATKDDLDGIAACAGFTNTLGTASTSATALDLAAFTAALTKSRVMFIKGQLNYVLHSYQYHAFANSLISHSYYGTLQPAADEMGKKFRVNEFMGVRFFEDNNIELKSTGATQWATGFVFPSSALIRVEKRGLRIEKQRDASFRRTELNATTRYGYGLPDASQGIKMAYLAVTPS